MFHNPWYNLMPIQYRHLSLTSNPSLFSIVEQIDPTETKRRGMPERGTWIEASHIALFSKVHFLIQQYGLSIPECMGRSVHGTP